MMSESNCTLSSSFLPKADLQSHTNLHTSLLSSCRICLSSIFEPACLGCGHRFCEKCLNTYWHVRDKPDFIVCPLCRASAYNVYFAKEKEDSSTEDFRKVFNTVSSSGSDSAVLVSRRAHDGSLLCLKISILMPTIYFLAKLMRPAIISLMSFFSDMMAAMVYLV